jgi:hypothetical protein
MKRQFLLLLNILYLCSLESFTQSVNLSSPRLEFDGTQLHISYDIIDRNPSDFFYVWVEIGKKNGEVIKVKSLSGDIGEYIKTGSNKKITWNPGKDSIFLDEEVNVEVKAGKYEKPFNKGSMMLLSTAIPGLGQTKISKGRPWWLTSVFAYGAVAGGFMVHQSYLKTYDSYQVETDAVKRSDLFNKTQKQMNQSNALIFAGAGLWAANIIWVAVTPDKLRLPQNIKLSLDKGTGTLKGTNLLSLKIDF